MSPRYAFLMVGKSELSGTLRTSHQNSLRSGSGSGGGLRSSCLGSGSGSGGGFGLSSDCVVSDVHFLRVFYFKPLGKRSVFEYGSVLDVWRLGGVPVPQVGRSDVVPRVGSCD